MAKNPFSDPAYGAEGAASTATSNPFSNPDYGKEPSRGFKGWAGDALGVVARGAISVPEAAVGLLDIPTGGAVGKTLENEGGSVGLRFKQAKEAASDLFDSDATKQQNQQFQQADGIVEKAKVALSNPSMIFRAVGESLPAIGAGGVASRGLMAATKLGQMGAQGAALAGAAGEGITMAGSAAEQIRQETKDGLLTPEQAGLAAATGVVGGAVSALGGRVANKLGIGDAETMLAQGTKGMAKQNADDAATAAVNPLVQQAAAKSIPRRVVEGAISEGFLEELPQSVAEQIFQNVALGKDWLTDVDSAAVMGVLSGAAMGGAASGYHGFKQPQAQAGELPSGQPGAATADAGAVPANPGMERIQQEFAAQLAALQQQEQGDPNVPQTTPPDGAAALAQQQAQAAAQRQAAMDASRAVQSPDDEIYQSTGATVPRSVAMGLDPAAGPLSASAALAVDTGASDQVQQAAALAQAAEVAQKQGKKSAQGNQKQEQQALTQQGVNQETGEISQGSPMESWSDAQLSNTFRGAQSREVRMQLAQELGRRRALREQQELQAELDDKQADTVPGAERADAAFASVTEDAQADVPASDPQLSAREQAGLASSLAGRELAAQPLSSEMAGLQAQLAQVQQRAADNGSWNVPLMGQRRRIEAAIAQLQAAEKPTTQGVPDGPQAAQAQQDRSQPPQGGAAPAVPSTDANAQGRPGADGAQQAAAAGLIDGAPTENPGAQGTPAAGAQTATAAEPEFTTIKTVYGDSVTVRTADLNSDKPRLRQYTKDGKSKAVPAIHRDNLDLTGDKRASIAKEDADNPFFNVITTKNGSTFANQAAASRELNRLAMGETHEVVAASEVQDGAQGFVIRRKLADAMGGRVETGANQVAAPTQQAQAAAENVASNSAGQDDGVNPRVPRENRAPAKPIEQSEQKEPWQMTALEFGQQERGNPHWNQSYEGKDDGAYLADTAATHRRLVQEAIAAAPQKVADDFIPAPDGGLDYGEITPEMGKAMRRQAGKIRLQQGDASFGLQHIELRHGDEIRKAGFESIEAFVSGAVADIESIWKPEATSQLVVIQATERGKVVFIQLQAGKDDDGDFYTVKTAFPSSRTYAEKRKEWKQLWSRVPVPAADTGKSAPSAELGNEAGSKSTMESGQSDAVSVPPTPETPQPITRADVTAAHQQAATLIAERIDAMTAGEVNTIARRFLPTMGVKPTVSKERNKAAMTDFTKVNLMAAADEVGAKLPADVRRALDAEMQGKVADGYVEREAAEPANDRNAFTLQRLNRDTDQMEPVTFERGEYVRHRIAGKDHFGEIDGISHARREFSVGGLWYAFGFANKAERPVAPKADTVPLSSVIDKVNAKNGQGLTDADRVPEQKPASKTPTVDRHNATMAAVRKGQATAEQFRASFEQVVDGKAAIVAELDTMTKVQLLREGGPFVQMRYANEKKADVVDAVYREMVGEYALGESVTYSMGKGAYESAVRKMVEATDADKLARYVTDRKAAVEEMQARRAAKAAAIENPQTLADFREVLNAKIREGMTRKEAFLTLTPQQRIQYDTLEAESTREARENRKRAQKTEVRAAGQTTAGEIVATKHTRDGYDLFVVKLADRLSKEDYSTVLASAKKLGGWYSAFRGNGAIPGFQFKDKANAEAFLALAGGDTTAAQEQVAQRRDAFEDDRSQTAVERLRAMADKLEEGAAEVEGQQRKTNTERRARFASAAMASAAADKAKAQTMRNIARAIEGGEAKFLDAVRTKSQVDMLTGIVDTAKGAELRAKYPSYADQEKRKGEPPTAETADFAEFPSYSAFRSDLATLGRQLLEVDGTKKLGQRLMSVADDVTDAYLEFAKANIQQVSQFGRGDALAEFASKDEAERAIKRSGLTGKAIVLPIKRGQNRVILSPSEAIGRGLWQGDGDKRITLTAEFGAELVEAIGRRGNKQNQLAVPWQFQNAYDRRKALSRIGIETPSEFRAALREFIGLKEQAVANRTRAMELQMVGRKADGLDFFPTSAEVADQMIEAADLTPDMAVLEPSAGMGHLADRIREAGAEPDVIEISADRRELLEEKGYTTQAVDDFLDLKPREFYTFGDTFRAPDGTEGIMRGANGNRVKLVNQTGDMVGAGYYDRADLTGIAHNGTASGYDRIIMNPPFSNRRDAEHVRHAYSLLKPGGRIVAIMGEGVFFGQDKKAQDFREWLESVGGTSEKLPEGSFMDPSLPVNTSVNARMVVIDRADGVAMFSSADATLPTKPLSLNRVNQLVQEALSGIRGAPPVEVTARPADVGLKVPAGSVGYGVTLRSGDIYVFQSAMGSDLDVFKTVFHELFHRGVRVLVPKGQYVQTMLDLAKGDSRIQQLAIEWKNTEMGQKQKDNLRKQGYTGSELTGQYEALAIEEALAAVAEEIKAEGRLGSKPKNMTIRFLANWLAKLADLAGMKKLAAGIRAMTYNEAERFVMSAIDRSGEPVQAGRTDNLSAKQAAPAGDQTQTEAFKRWFKDSKVVDAEGKPQSAVQTTPEEAEAVDGSPGDVAAFRRDGAESSERATEFDVDSFLKAMGRPSAYSEAARRQAIDSVSATVDAIRTAWGPNAPEVVVAFDMQDERIPEAARKADLRQRSGGARGAPEGFYYRGKAYLMASRLNTPNDAARVLYHEVLGHHGLRGKFGRDLDQVLNQIATMRKAEVAAKMQEYGLRGVNNLSVREAAEEVLAEMAEKNPQLPFVQRAISAIRNFLRTHVPGFQSLRLTDSDIIQAYILPARGWVEHGGPDGGPGGELGFSRSDETPLRQASTFTEAREAAQEFQGKALTNEATGLQANVSRNTLDKMLSRKAVEKSASAQAQSRAVANLDRLYQGAIFGWSKEDRDGNTNVRAVHRFFVPMDMDGRTLMAKLTVKETVDANHANPLYTVEAVDFNEKSPAAVWVDASAKADGIDLTSIRSAGDVLSLAQEIEQRNAEDDGGTMFSRSKMADIGASGLEKLQEALSHPGKVSLWDKTVGTMRNLAERSPVFKPVYEAAQRFIDDVSMLGNDAADRAPRLLPRVETLADLKKKPITAADNQAVAKPLFEGTLLWARDVDGTPVTTEALNAKYRNTTPDEKAQILLRTGKIQEQMLKVWRGLPVDQYNTIINNKFDSTILKPGVVWTAKELKDLFGLSAEQVSLYQEARAAIDRSIDMTARADMLRALGAGYAGLREAVLAQSSAEDAMVLITDTLQAEARELPDQADRILSLNNAVVKSYERAQALMEAGYAPLSRFGRYTVDVVAKDGTREYFGMFESMYDSNKMKAAMEKEFPGATVTQGTMSDEAFKLFQGITPESLEHFGQMLGLSGEGADPKDKAFQAYLQLAKNNHSALKRLIHRKGISGYSEDVGRVLASFVYSNARLAAGGLNAGTLETAIEGIPKEQGELRDVAMGLRSYIQDPQEEGQAVRGMLFAQYLGGSVASAMVNMTQPFQITMPWLSQFGGMRSAASHLAAAVRDMTRRSSYEPDLAKALQTAEAEGIVSPQEIHQLMAQARGAGSLRTGDGTKLGDARAAAANNWERVKVAWGQPFALAEQFNRRSTFIAAYRIAKEQGMADPAKFAERAVQETQFVYSKANKPKWARGTIGGTLFTFKTYSVSYLELMHRMWTQGGPEGKRAVGWAVAMLLLMGGAGGLPFMEDAEDLIDGAGQLMGYNISTKHWRKQALRDVVGKELADFMEQGVSGLPGAPIDVSGRLGMGNLIPGTGLLLAKQNRERDLLEVAGPAGDLVARGFTGARKLLTGDVAGAALEVSPTAARNWAKGIDMGTSGIYKDAKGYKVIDTTLDEAIAKFAGFQPKSVAEVQEANSFMQRSKSFYIQTSSDIKAQWAKAVFEKDDAALQRVRDRLAAWNRNNPDQPIVVKIPDVMKRVREMGKDRTQRIEDTAPKALRSQMREMARENG